MDFGEKTLTSFYFGLPACLVLVGSSGSGKTTFVHKFVKHFKEIAPGSLPVSRFVIVYNYYQRLVVFSM